MNTQFHYWCEAKDGSTMEFDSLALYGIGYRIKDAEGKTFSIVDLTSEECMCVSCEEIYQAREDMKYV